MTSRRGLLTGLGGAALLAACSPGGGEPSSPAPSGGGSTPVPSTPATSPAPASPSTTPTGPATVGKPVDVVTGLTSPWGLLVLDDESLLVSERDTKLIKRITDGKPATVTTVAQVSPNNEGGLLGIVLSPDKKWLYAYATTSRDNRVLRFSWSGSKVGDPEAVLTGIPFATNHDGGRLAFGPDEMLYVSTGDATVRANAQDKASLAGKILRLTPEGKPAPGNPFDNEVWSYGHRNVQGLAWDDRGRMWASEFGNQTLDELNLIVKGGNYGWPEIEGDASTKQGMTNPVRVWGTDDASPSGLAYSHGSLWMAALRGARLWEIPLSGDGTETPKAHFTGTYGRLRTVVGVDGGLLLTTSNTDGRGTVQDGDDRILRIPLT